MEQVVEELLFNYRQSLVELTNAKPIINNLTEIASETRPFAPRIVDLIVNRIREVPPHASVPPFYLLDSIAKNVQSPYLELFRPYITEIFVDKFIASPPDLKNTLLRLLNTWKEYYPREHEIIKQAIANYLPQPPHQPRNEAQPPQPHHQFQRQQPHQHQHQHQPQHQLQHHQHQQQQQQQQLHKQQHMKRGPEWTQPHVSVMAPRSPPSKQPRRGVGHHPEHFPTHPADPHAASHIHSPSRGIATIGNGPDSRPYSDPTAFYPSAIPHGHVPAMHPIDGPMWNLQQPNDPHRYYEDRHPRQDIVAPSPYQQHPDQEIPRPSNRPVKPTKPSAASSSTLSESAKPSKQTTPAVAPLDMTPSPDDFKNENLRLRKPNLIQSLYEGLTLHCRQCGFRFSDRDKCDRHHDWHFRRNREQKERSNHIHSRKYYMKWQDWSEYKEMEAIVPIEIPTIVEKNPEQGNEPRYPALGPQERCDKCAESFEKIWDEEGEDWFFKGVVENPASKRLVHLKCL
eukprot:TRINITY_DN2215_c1_g1_i1.p1 TRINITY_DN2215_c1_g1~~TRINITY_DN2215_c1_g1_i1.p1  ORF type:complete len:512 (+),score=107.51 TRINITY_DN2215_c1_g1_i1:670-2205(+)